MAPRPVTMSPELRARRSVPLAPPQAAPVRSPTMAPMVAAQQAYKEAGDPFNAFAQGWINSSAVREEDAAEQAKREEIATAFQAHPDLQKYVTNGVMEPSDALRIKETREAATKEAETTAARKAEITDYLGQLSTSDERYAPLLEQWGAGILDEDGLGKAIADIDKQPTPTDDQRELAQINQEREGKGEPPLTMEDFLASKRGQGLSIETNADGTVRVSQGGGKLTEAQSKDVGFYTRGLQANKGLVGLEKELTDFMMSKADLVPLGIGNYLKTPEFRQAKVEADNFLTALLRKDTGAAITDREFELYGPMFLPVPGDDEGTITLKRQKRATALLALRSGLGTAEAVAAANEANLDLENPVSEAAAAPAPEQPGGMPAPASQEEYDLLPPGTTYLAPDGTTRTKP